MNRHGAGSPSLTRRDRQRWRGNVKARHFVLALRDYCLDKLDKLKKHENTFGDCEYQTRVTEQDEWTLEYINVTRLQAIIEAFDDDASGFITVGEANAFTTSRPGDWRCVCSRLSYGRIN